MIDESFDEQVQNHLQRLADEPVCLAWSRYGGICGQIAPCDGTRHAPVEERTEEEPDLLAAVLAEVASARAAAGRYATASFELGAIPSALIEAQRAQGDRIRETSLLLHGHLDRIEDLVRGEQQ